MKDCIFCKISNKKIESNIIYENEFVLAFLDMFPNTDGHSLVIPKNHSNNLQESDDLFLKEVAIAKKQVAELLTKKLPMKPIGFNYVSNQGSDAYQSVFHYHEHIVPKYQKGEGLLFQINKDESKMSAIGEIYKALKE